MSKEMVMQNEKPKKKFVLLNKPWKEILYAASGFGPNLLMVILGAYFTDAINPAALSEGTLQAITTIPLILPAIFPILWALAKMFDGIIDIPLAALTDGLRTKWGRRRIPILVSFIPMVLTYVLMWIPIGKTENIETNQIINTIWITIMALIFFAAYTMSLIAFYGSLSTVCVNEKQRTKVSSYKAFFDTISYVITYALVPLLLKALNIRIDKLVYILVPLMLTMLIPVFMIKEGDKHEQKLIEEGYDITPLVEEEKVGIIESIKLTFTNRIFLRWLAVNCCTFFGLQMFLVSMNTLIDGGMGMDGGQMAILNTCAFAPVPIMLYLFNKVKDRKGIRFAYQTCLISFSVCILSFVLASRFVMGENNVTLQMIIGCVGGVIGSWGIGSFFMMPYLIPAQISSVEEKLTKRNHSAMYFAAQAVTSSVVGAIAGGLVYESIKMLFISKEKSGVVWAENVEKAAVLFGASEASVHNLSWILVPVIVSVFCFLGFMLAFRMPRNYTPKKVSKALGLEKEYEENKHLFHEAKEPVIEEEVLPVSIALFVLSGTLFGAIWRYGIINKINVFNPKKTKLIHYILSILLPPYYAYVVYLNSKALYEECKKQNIEMKDFSVLYAVLAVFGQNIVSHIVMQIKLNKVAKIYNV
ncbi:MAG: MFS transporter [Bacillota bacterium]|mgnify:CR=1 FL=1|jgi:Na+/melibiose symporter-like transporter|nr:MFS transporter [Bacillota bacterium]